LVRAEDRFDVARGAAARVHLERQLLQRLGAAREPFTNRRDRRRVDVSHLRHTVRDVAFGRLQVGPYFPRQRRVLAWRTSDFFALPPHPLFDRIAIDGIGEIVARQREGSRGLQRYFFPRNVKSCVWLPVTALEVDVTVTDPPDATIDNWLAVSVTMWLCAESVDDVYVMSVGCS